MKNDFYTFGGIRFWEDVFFYQKWRIQRNHISKSYRLLDNWDIKRHEGTFEECQNVFAKYLDAYEIAKPNGHMIIMVHSLGQSKNIFKPMWRRAIKDGYQAAAVNYPSTQKSLDLHVKQFKFLLEHLTGVDKISFITLGSGNAIVQELFKNSENIPSYISFEKCVFINPTVCENKILKKLYESKLMNFVIGPMGKDLTEPDINKLAPLSKMESIAITTNKPFGEKILELLTFTFNKKVDDENIKSFTGSNNVINIQNYKSNIFDNPAITETIMNFLTGNKI